MANSSEAGTTGDVELWLNGKWHHVCYSSMNMKSAHVMCRSAGFVSGHVERSRHFEQYYFYYNLAENVHIYVECTGSESSIKECARGHFTYDRYCDQARVSCYRKCETFIDFTILALFYVFTIHCNKYLFQCLKIITFHENIYVML